MPTFDDVKAFLQSHALKVLEFAQPTPTAAAAAAAVGCPVDHIAKTVLLLVGESPVAVVASGDSRVVGARVKKCLGLSGRVRLPRPDEVEALTGYRPGGVSPFLLPAAVPVLLDARLGALSRLYPAAGSDRSAVALDWDALQRLTGGRVVDVARTPDETPAGQSA